MHALHGRQVGADDRSRHSAAIDPIWAGRRTTGRVRTQQTSLQGLHHEQRVESPGLRPGQCRRHPSSVMRVFEQLTPRARRVMALAQDEARVLRHSSVGTEHILLGLLEEAEGVGVSALVSLGISLQATRAEIEEIIGQGHQTPSGHIPLTPRAENILGLSAREARQLGHDYIGTEHLLLGLIRDEDGVAAQVLVNRGADLTRVRRQVTRLLSGYPVPQERAPDERQPQSAAPVSSQGMARYAVEVQFELSGEGDGLETAVRLTHEALRGPVEPTAADLNLALRLLIAEAVIRGISEQFPLQARAKVQTVTVTDTSGHNPEP